MTTQRKKKESFVVFEDWMRYARCLNDAEFRQLMTNILNYCKGQSPALNTPMLQEIWSDIIDDLEINVDKKQAKRDTMLRNAKTNPKLNIVSNIKPDIEPDIKSNTAPNIAGMVDGRCDMVDEPMVDIEMDDEWMIDSKTSDVKTTLRVNSYISSSGRIQHPHSLVDKIFGDD